METLPLVTRHRHVIRLVILGVLLFAAMGILFLLILQSDIEDIASSFGLDHRAYWSAGRLLITGGNPYNRSQMLSLELLNGHDNTQPLMVWSAPWTLTPLILSALLPFPVSSIMWLYINTILAACCGAFLWRELAPATDHRYWLGALTALLYVPTIQELKLGQISILILVGVVGFLAFFRRNHDYLAGAALSTIIYKPHLVLPLMVCAAWWVIRERRWKVALGFLISTIVLVVVPVIISPSIYSDFIYAESGLPLNWRSATLGTWLRDLFGYRHYWLQYLPAVVGVAVTSIWVLFHKGRWDWVIMLPSLLLASVVSAPFAWSHDTVILLPVIVLMLTRVRSLTPGRRIVVIGLYVLSQLGLLIQNQLYLDNATFYWFPLALLALYMWQQPRLRLVTDMQPGQP